MHMTWNDQHKPATVLQPLTGALRCPLCKTTQPADTIKQELGASNELLTCAKCAQQTPRKFWKQIEG